MKAKTILELVTLTSSLYTLSKETGALDKLAAVSEKGKEKINDFVKEKIVDDEGNEVEFLDKLMLKAQEAKQELDAKIAEMVEAFYEKVNIAHTDKIKLLEDKIEELNRDLALAEARISKLENKQA